MGSLNNANVLNKLEVEALLQPILEQEGLTQAKLEISAGSQKGDGYLSYLTKVDITGEDKKLNLIIKCAPKSEEFRKVAPINTIFLREIYFYEKIFPTFRDFQLTKNVKHPFVSVAKCYKTIEEPGNELLVLQNIKEEGYTLWDRRIPMDENHVIKAYKTYAKYHAISYALQQQEPETYGNLTCNMADVFNSTDNSEMFDGFVNGAERIQKYFTEDSDRGVYDALENIKNNIMETFLFFEKNKGKHSVISHGDCWCNNVLFKYNDPLLPKNPTDILLLDFQLVGVTSPVQDLSYFFYVSGAKELLPNLDKYLKIYHDDLVEFATELGADPTKLLTFEDLKQEWKTYGKFGFLMALLIVRAMLSEDDELIDMSDVAASGQSITDAFNRVKKSDGTADERLAALAVHLYQNGFF